MSRLNPPASPSRPRLPDLPPPGAEANAHSLRMLEKLRTQIATCGGAISFEQYMRTVLYQPELGYYCSGSQKFGAQGDFITAPEMSFLFAHCLAAFVFRVNVGTELLEVGAGSGRLAANLLSILANQEQPPDRYYIVELSAELQRRQRETIQQTCPAMLERVIWLDELPDGFCGVVIANELLDAMPVRRFRVREQKLYEQYVAWCDGVLCYLDKPINDVRLLDRIATLREQTNMSQASFYLSEVNFMAEDWVRNAGKKIRQGTILLIDYGYPRSAYYHAQRSSGTLMCHYQHHAHPDPLILPGLQDITAHVDFTAMADAALEANMRIDGFTTQAHFLLNMGVLDMAAHTDLSERERLMVNSEIKKMTLETEMGEQFKVMACSKGDSFSVPGFEHHDMRHLL